MLKKTYIKSAYDQLQVISQDKQKRLEKQSRKCRLHQHILDFNLYCSSNTANAFFLSFG